MRLSSYLKEHLEKAGQLPVARQTHAAALQRLEEFFGGDCEVSTITKVELERYAVWLAKKFHAPTCVVYLQAAKRALSAHPQSLAKEEVRILLAASPTEEWRGLICLVIEIGVSLDDALSLLWKNLQSPLLRYRSKRTRDDIQLSLGHEALDILAGLSRGRGGFLFPVLRHRKPAKLLEELEVIAASVGMNDKRSTAAFRRAFLGIAD